MGTFLKIGWYFGNSCVRVSRTSTNSALLGPWSVLNRLNPLLSVIATRNYAARKGTRERKEKIYRANRAKNKALQEKLKNNPPPHLKAAMLKRMTAGRVVSKLPDDSTKPVPQDNVWLADMYRRPMYTIEEAVRNFQESHHPSILNLPHAYIKAWIEMDLSTKKRNAFASAAGVVLYPNPVPRGLPNRVCVFCKTSEQIDEALKAGAHTAVGLEGIKMFQEGKLDDEDYEYFVSHIDIVAEITPLRGILNLKYPSVKRGNVGFNLANLVRKYMHGVQYSVKQDAAFNSFGIIHVDIGQVSMDPKHIEENFNVLVKDILKQKPKNSTGPFVQKAMLMCEGTSENFEINLQSYLTEDASNSTENQSADVEEEPEREIASA